MIAFIFILLLTFSNLSAQFVKAKIQVSGLTCSMCNLATCKSLESIDFIEKVETDLDNLFFHVTFKKDAKIELEVMAKQIKDAGFFISNIEITTILPKTEIKKDLHLPFNNEVLHFWSDFSGNVDGQIVLQVIDKGFIDEKEYKKFAKNTTWNCYKTGKTGSCCNMGENKKVYHVIALR